MCRNKTSGALLGIILAVVVYGLSSGASFLSKKKKKIRILFIHEL
jgi:hypothetical protein